MTTNLVDSSGFDEPYRAQPADRLLSIATDLLARLDERPVDEPTPVLSLPGGPPLSLGAILLADGAVVSPTDAVAVGDPYADLSFLARELATAIGPAAVPALFDAAGIERPDPVRIEFWITLRQLLL